jgi:hypothetical protein
LRLYPNYDALPWEFLKISGHAMRKLNYLFLHGIDVILRRHTKFSGELI